jgi:hypothetical protein
LEEDAMKRVLFSGLVLAVLAAPAFGQGVGVQVGPVGAGISFEPQQRT